MKTSQILNGISTLSSIGSLIIAAIVVVLGVSFFGLSEISTAMIIAAGVALLAVVSKVLASISEHRASKAYLEKIKAGFEGDKRRRPQVFISYAHEDLPRVRKLEGLLYEEGFRPWIDRDSLAQGDNWLDGIQRAIGESDYILPVITDHSVDPTGFTQSEIKLALDISKNRKARSHEHAMRILPVLLDKAPMPMDISGVSYIDATGPNGFQRVVQTLAQMDIGSRVVHET